MTPSAKPIQEQQPRCGPRFCYKGDLSWRDFTGLAQSVQQWLDAQDLRGPRRRKAYSTFIEMVYNILNHAAPISPGLLDGPRARRVHATIALGSEGHDVWLVAENQVDRSRTHDLAQRLQQIVDLAPSELKLLYRNRLATAGDYRSAPAGNGAGLGLLTIARDAARPIEYSLAAAGFRGELMTFSLKVHV